MCGCSLMSEEYWRRVLRQDEWRAVSLGRTGKTDPCPLKRNASGNWGSRGVSPLAGSRGRPRAGEVPRGAWPPLASFLPDLSRSKDRAWGSGGRSAPVYGRRAAGPHGRRAARRRPKGTLPENYRSPPARVSPGETGGSAAHPRPRQKTTDPRKKAQRPRLYRSRRLYIRVDSR